MGGQLCKPENLGSNDCGARQGAGSNGTEWDASHWSDSAVVLAKTILYARRDNDSVGPYGGAGGFGAFFKSTNGTSTPGAVGIIRLTYEN